MPRTTATTLDQPVFHEPVFNETTKTVAPAGFLEPHPSDNALYAQIEDLLSKDVVSFPASRLADGEVVKLADIYGDHGADLIEQITTAGQIVFHAVGDTGAAATNKYRQELTVADQLSEDCHTSDEPDHPSFFFQLGDVVYNFGEARYYYDQFYDPYRDYPLPIFALAGNHDSFIVPNTPEGQEPLTTFARNFCADELTISPDAGSLHRTAMTQPGVYFTLDAPFVRIIGLFSNALEDPGVLAGSQEGGNWKAVPDLQLAYLAAQLKRIKDEEYKGAVLIAVHHPPFSYAPPPDKAGKGGVHGSSSDMLRLIDKVCLDAGVYPHAFLSAHAHNYQRYTRTVKFAGEEYDVPFVVCGSGGHGVDPVVRGKKGHPAVEPANGTDVSYLESKPAVETGGLVLEKYDDRNYGYLKVIVDAQQLKIGFHQVSEGVSLAQSRYDLVTVDLASHTMVSN